MLALTGLEVGYGQVAAVRGIDLTVHEGEIVALIGGNGAGKTTTLSAIAGLLKPRAGSIALRGEAIAGEPPERLVGRGMSLVQEGRQVVPQLTVQENLCIGAYLRRGDTDVDLERIYGIFPRLKERHGQPAGSLSGGEQQMLAIGRALMARPSLLLLDEPSMGLAPLVIERIFEVIRQINEEDVTIVLVEQQAVQALRIAHRAYVLENGSIRLSGPAAEIRENPAVIDAYLGGRRQGR
ncbi:ABC transporter ATP-binding protein [Chelatococcus reniformis]|uniref:ABC transporter ATP-binding protein n=1 Tax=Chelatococcus reniformis TaxID=1494448 RepID=UPI00357172C8